MDLIVGSDKHKLKKPPVEVESDGKAGLMDARGDPPVEGKPGLTSNTKMLEANTKSSLVLIRTPSQHMALMGASPVMEEIEENDPDHHHHHHHHHYHLTRPHPLNMMKESCLCYWEQMKKTHSLPVLEPNGYFIRMWNPSIFALTIYGLIVVPFDLAFAFWKPPWIYKVFGKIADFILITDIALHFNTAIIHGDHMVYDRRTIAIHYAKTWLLVDAVSNFPWDWFVGTGGKHRKLLKFLKLPKILRFVRMLRLLKAQTHFIGVGAAILGIVIFAHYSGCAWVLAILENSCDYDSSDCDDVAGTYAEALAVSMAALSGSDAWTRFIYGATSSRIARFRDGQYLSGWEEMLASVGVAFGYVLLAILFGTVNSAIEQMNARGRKRFNKLQARKMDMKNAEIPWSLQKRVEAIYEQTWMFGDWHDGFLRDDTLSLDLRRNLAYHVYGPALRSVPMLSEFSSADLKCLAQRINSHCYTPGDLIIQSGERAREMCLVFSGIAQPLDREGHVLDQVLLRKGDFFGEICFLFPGRRRTASVACIQFCRIMVLTIEVFQELGLEHLLDVIRQTCASRIDFYVMSHTDCVLPCGFDKDDPGRLGRKAKKVSIPASEEADTPDNVETKVSAPEAADPCEPTIVGAPTENPGVRKKKWGRKNPTPEEKNSTPEEPLLEKPNDECPQDDTAAPMASNSTQRKVGVTSKPGKGKAETQGKVENQGSVMRLLGEIQEAAERNTSEILNRFARLERSQEELKEIVKQIRQDTSKGKE